MAITWSSDMNWTVQRLDSLRRLLAHVRERLAFDVGFVLWDGSTIPAQLGASELAIAIADEGAVAALVRRPNADTLINLWVSARLDIRNGSVFDLVARRPKVSTKATLKTLDKRLMLATAAKFLLVPRGGPWPLEQRSRRQGQGRRQRIGQQGERALSLRPLECVLRALPRSGDDLHLRVFHQRT